VITLHHMNKGKVQKEEEIGVLWNNALQSPAHLCVCVLCISPEECCAWSPVEVGTRWERLRLGVTNLVLHDLVLTHLPNTTYFIL